MQAWKIDLYAFRFSILQIPKSVIQNLNEIFKKTWEAFWIMVYTYNYQVHLA